MERNGLCYLVRPLVVFRFVYYPRLFGLMGANEGKAAALWVSEAAIGVGYPEENRKGVYCE
jgi:hypothetical protein